MSFSKNHWNNIYATKHSEEVSWNQEVPKISIETIEDLELDKSARIIDVGGGDSKLVDYLLDKEFEHITVLDISEISLAKAKKRLGTRAEKVNWIACDIIQFKPDTTYDYWHDRAAFHFLTTKSKIDKYISIAGQSINNNGFLTLGTFSTDGPDKCSGLNVRQYSEQSLSAQLQADFEKIKCISIDHVTPFNTRQNFLFCSFRKLES